MKNKSEVKQQRKAAFKNYMLKVAANTMGTGIDHYMYLLTYALMMPNGKYPSKRAYFMKWDKKEYAHIVYAMRNNLNYMKINNIEYGKHSSLNCNNMGYIFKNR